MAWIAAAAAVGGSLISSMSGSKAAKASAKGQAAALQATLEAEQRAKASAIPLFNASNKNALMGFQGALDIQGQFAPEQMRVFQEGNMQAQNTMRSGLDPQIAAILGGNVDLSGLQAQQVQTPDASMFQQQLPEFQDMLDTLPSESARYIPGAWDEIQERTGGQAPINPNNPFEQNPYLSGYVPPPPMQDNDNYMSRLSAIGNNVPAMLAGQYGIPVQHSGVAGMSPPKNFLGGY